MLWMPCLPQACIERDVIVADLELFACGFKVDLPPYAIDDQPMADLFVALIDHLKRKSLEVVPYPWVSLVPVPEVPFTLFKRYGHRCFTSLHIF